MGGSWFWLLEYGSVARIMAVKYGKNWPKNTEY